MSAPPSSARVRLAMGEVAHLVTLPADWVEFFRDRLGPHVSVEPAPAGFRPHRTVVVARGALEVHPTGEERWVDLHSGERGRLVVDGGRTVVRCESGQAAYEVRGGDVTLRYAGPGDGGLDALQVVRGLLVADVEHRGWVRTHGAVVVLDDRGIVLAGHKGAGKTSFALSLAARHGAGLVTNDKFLHRRTGHRTELRGLPLAAPVHGATLRSLPRPAQEVTGRSANDKTYFWPGDLALGYGFGLAASAVADAVLLCRLEPGSPVAVERIDGSGQAGRHELADLGSALAASRDKVTPHWLLELTGPPAPQAPSVGALAGVPAFRLAGDPADPRLRSAIVSVMEEAS